MTCPAKPSVQSSRNTRLTSISGCLAANRETQASKASSVTNSGRRIIEVHWKSVLRE